MSRLEKILVASIFLVLVCLAAVILLQSVSPQAEDRVYNISVLADDLNDYCRRGMDKAALEYNVDVHYITGFAGRGYQQSEYLRREIENGVDAVILRAEDPAFLSEWLLHSHAVTPVITVGDALPGSDSAVRVAPDDQTLGQMLGARIISTADGLPCVLLTEHNQRAYLTERCNALTSVLTKAGISVERREFIVAEGGIAEALMQYPRCVAVVVNERLLPQLVKEAPEGARLLGIGYVNEVRTALESGRLEAVAVYSAFDEGYIAMRLAVEAARAENPQDIMLSGMLADADSMYQAPLAQMLFPIA